MNHRVSDPAGVPRAGEVISGKYQVVSVLGAGGMGVVVAAQHLQLGRKVALKLLSPEVIQDAPAVARFLQEARAAAEIQSEHVVRVFDVAQAENGAPYIVMEHLDGRDLEQLVSSRGPLPVDKAAD